MCWGECVSPVNWRVAMFEGLLSFIAAFSALVVAIAVVREAYPAESYQFLRVEDAPRFNV